MISPERKALNKADRELAEIKRQLDSKTKEAIADVLRVQPNGELVFTIKDKPQYLCPAEQQMCIATISSLKLIDDEIFACINWDEYYYDKKFLTFFTRDVIPMDTEVALDLDEINGNIFSLISAIQAQLKNNEK